MKQLSLLFAVMMVGVLALQGCSSNTRESMKSDINEAARDTDRAIKDAVD